MPHPASSQRRRAAHNDPPQFYTDLSHRDIKLLAQILGQVPPAQTSAYEVWARRSTTLISQLPRHLQAKGGLPLLGESRMTTTTSTNFCTLHRKIAPLPVKDMYEALAAEVDEELYCTWIPLRDRGVLSPLQAQMVAKVEDLSAVWLAPEAVYATLNRPVATPSARRPENPECAACCLAQLCSDFQAVVALAGCMIGRMTRGIWSRSNRIRWVIESARGFVPEEKQGYAEEMLWKFGYSMRNARKRIKAQRSYALSARISRSHSTAPGRNTVPDDCAEFADQCRYLGILPPALPRIEGHATALSWPYAAPDQTEQLSVEARVNDGRRNNSFGRPSAQHGARFAPSEQLPFDTSISRGQRNNPFDRPRAQHTARSIFRSQRSRVVPHSHEAAFLPPLPQYSPSIYSQAHSSSAPHSRGPPGTPSLERYDDWYYRSQQLTVPEHPQQGYSSSDSVPVSYAASLVSGIYDHYVLPPTPPSSDAQIGQYAREQRVDAGRVAVRSSAAMFDQASLQQSGAFGRDYADSRTKQESSQRRVLCREV